MGQTPIEWLKDVLYPYLNKEDKEFTDTLFNQAKEMEKTSICSFTTGYVNNCVEIDHNEIELTKEVDEYYDWLESTKCQCDEGFCETQDMSKEIEKIQEYLVSKKFYIDYQYENEQVWMSNHRGETLDVDTDKGVVVLSRAFKEDLTFTKLIDLKKELF